MPAARRQFTYRGDRATWRSGYAAVCKFCCRRAVWSRSILISPVLSAKSGSEKFYDHLERYSPAERIKYEMSAKMDRETAETKISRALKKADRIYNKHIKPFQRAHETALDAVLEMPATTVAGVAAVMERLAEISGPRNAYLPEDWEQDFLASAAATLKRVAENRV